MVDPITEISCTAMAEKLGETQPGFEGVEKRLEIDIKPGSGKGARVLPREFWEEVLNKLNAKIIDVQYSGQIDGYLLSESSLFVSSNRVTLITCGVTLLLNCLETLVKGLESQNLEVEYVQYSRKNFTYPWLQAGPHFSLSNEYSILHKYFPEGQPFIMGPINSDHYFFYLMDRIDRPSREEVDQLLNLVMYDLDPDFSKVFTSAAFEVSNELTAKARVQSGLNKLFEGFEIVQDALFCPCGYSANSILGDAYYTTHITPEEHCSYASFETNKCTDSSFVPLIQSVLDIFRPKRFTVVILADELSPCGISRTQNNPIGTDPCYDKYQMTNKTDNQFQPGYHIVKANFIAS